MPGWRPKRKKGREGYKPNSVCVPFGTERTIYLSGHTRNLALSHGAGRSEVSYLALHPIGFSVPPPLLSERWALTPPFHPCLSRFDPAIGGLFSVALSIGTPRGAAFRLYPEFVGSG